MTVAHLCSWRAQMGTFELIIVLTALVGRGRAPWLMREGRKDGWIGKLEL